jgi:glycosyltransferase involved in cell wall biosynthesis
MKLAYLSPLPPSPSGVADYSAALLPELAREAEIDLFYDEPALVASLPRGARSGVRSVREFESLHARYAAVIYHMGNSAHHDAIYDALLRYPGIVVLHDGTLHHFFVDRTLHRGDGPSYLREMAYAHGEAGYDAAVLIARGAGIFPFYRFPLIRRAVDRAQGVIVHSDTLRRAVLKARPGARVRVIDHLAFPPNPPAKTREAMLRELGLPRAAFVVASFGQVALGKRGEIALQGFSRFAENAPHTRFIWVGDSSGEYDLRQGVEPLGLKGKVIFTGRVPADDLPNYLALCDVAINLRFPTTGEASGAVMRLLAYGKPTLVSNVGWFAELPSEVVVKVDVGRGESEAVGVWLTRLATDPALYARTSAAAREFARERMPPRAAREYLDFVREVAGESYARAA